MSTPIERRSISGYEGIYEVSSDGRIYSLERYVLGGPGGDNKKFVGAREIKITRTQAGSGDGYTDARVCLYKEGKRTILKVHHLVANAFLSRTNQRVKHLDGDSMNCSISNIYLI